MLDGTSYQVVPYPRYLIPVHNELRYLVKEEDKYCAAPALQISNLWMRAMSAYMVGVAHMLNSVFLAQTYPRYLKTRQAEQVPADWVTHSISTSFLKYLSTSTAEKNATPCGKSSRAMRVDERE